MLIMCLFSLSAILAPVLIAIYILQHFTLGKEPTLMVPNWQNRAVKRQTICCLLRGGWSALAPVCVHVCACMCMVCVYVYTCMCACCVCVWMHTRVCVRDPGGEGVSKEGSGHLSLVQRDPCPPWPPLPPGLSTRSCRSAGAPREALEPEGSRDHRLPPCSQWLCSFSLQVFLFQAQGGYIGNTSLIQWRDFIPVSTRPLRPPCVSVVGRCSLFRPRIAAQDRPWQWARH